MWKTINIERSLIIVQPWKDHCLWQMRSAELLHTHSPSGTSSPPVLRTKQFLSLPLQYPMALDAAKASAPDSTLVNLQNLIGIVFVCLQAETKLWTKMHKGRNDQFNLQCTKKYFISYLASFSALSFTVALENSAILRAECPHASLDLHGYTI